jgi:glycerol-3-phosphate dehydrogenase
VSGVRLRDRVGGRRADVQATVVINATGAWADELRVQVGARARIRPLRGSHLVFPAWRLPLAQAVSFLHPLDRRPVFLFPWEGVTLVGTTDLDHGQPLNAEPQITPEEVAYLMAAVDAQFPSLDLTLDDVISTFAGVRPVIGSGKADPSKESRDHVVWEESGLLTVTGGKLTTFRRIALDALHALRDRLPEMPELQDDVPVLDPVDIPLPGTKHLKAEQRQRLLGRYGAAAAALTETASTEALTEIPGTETLWAELCWAARNEAVHHLDDLLLRRTRLGLLLPKGGREILPRVQALCRQALGWDEARWRAEVEAYLELWANCYSLPPRASIPDWKAALAEAEAQRAMRQPRRRKLITGSMLGAVLLALGIVGGVLYFRRRT